MTSVSTSSLKSIKFRMLYKKNTADVWISRELRNTAEAQLATLAGRIFFRRFLADKNSAANLAIITGLWSTCDLHIWHDGSH